MSNILIGTASWTDKSLIASGRFYPAKCNSPEERLRYYASQFPLVEVDSSYYAMPKPEVAQLWAERTPPTFTFNIKAFRLFTGHQTSPAALPKDVAEALGPVEKRNLYYKDLPREITDEMWRQYREGIEPLKRSGKLAAVHFQFAPWVAYHPKSRDHIEECQRQLEGYQLAIEFRNKTWFEGKHAAVTLAFERERNLVNVIVDEPQGMANTIPSVWEVTNPALAIVRLHGRNHETWNKKGLTSSAERFNYDYNDDELAELGKKIEAITAASVHVVLNNLCGAPHKLFNAEPIVMRRRGAWHEGVPFTLAAGQAPPQMAGSKSSTSNDRFLRMSRRRIGRSNGSTRPPCRGELPSANGCNAAEPVFASPPTDWNYRPIVAVPCRCRDLQ